ncbi:MAG: bifunctional nuclease family protein [Deltaproteobacteria bacterium]|jgi:bifunctional DNase/RNase|nr:bifunctional nuclease family protein [Deltaproteobacteria bacterium]HXK29516.1 bifunctional nuclease family protein [Candidatus Binatia bacterium]MBI2182332.1 bifunctional nuclease family protein [Deltaproteobacteria bacterium]MBI2230526.1 bifunctional nuclease family protein [Deltaproteobacteria bacterium]MBI2367974.1 bifunctional nuclease family protein [Deltaproteobacteria bacterium]
MSKREDTIQMSVGGLTLDPVTKTPIVILKDTENKLNLPIWIGLLEATAMATEIEGIKMARPMTHDLLKNILGEVGCSVESVEITELKENTYYASVHLSLGGRRVMIDSRPSDAIAIALRTKSPIYVAKAVLEASSVLQQGEEGKEGAVENVSNVSKEKWSEILENMAPEDFKYKQ